VQFWFFSRRPCTIWHHSLSAFGDAVRQQPVSRTVISDNAHFVPTAKIEIYRFESAD
jgi:hypothetical protein